MPVNKVEAKNKITREDRHESEVIRGSINKDIDVLKGISKDELDVGMQIDFDHTSKIGKSTTGQPSPVQAKLLAVSASPEINNHTDRPAAKRPFHDSIIKDGSTDLKTVSRMSFSKMMYKNKMIDHHPSKQQSVYDY